MPQLANREPTVLEFHQKVQQHGQPAPPQLDTAKGDIHNHHQQPLASRPTDSIQADDRARAYQLVYGQFLDEDISV